MFDDSSKIKIEGRSHLIVGNGANWTLRDQLDVYILNIMIINVRFIF